MEKRLSEKELLEGLQAQARSLGSSATGILPVSQLKIEERFAQMCGGPTPCPSYGLAPGCPPNAPSPEAFKRQLQEFHTVLVFKIDVPVTELLGKRRLTVARSIHRIAATLERSAVSRGMTKAKGMAAGSCKELFCGDEDACVVLANGRDCHHPDLARPSISAVGVDFSALAQQLGWPFGRLPSATETGAEPVMGLMAGLVLLG
jgi:predicted metal-binding protein